MVALPHYKQESDLDKDRCPRARNFYKDSQLQKNWRDNFPPTLCRIFHH